MSASTAPNLIAAVDEGRQWDRLMELAKLGAITGTDGSPGVNRACLTPLDREARRLLISWAEGLGLTVSVDEIGNLFLRHEGTDAAAAPVLTGSHMDTQPNGGRFDGIWGVIAGLEAVQAIREAGVQTKRPIEVVAWTNEEGGRFAPGCMGSMAYAHYKPSNTWDAVADHEGVTFRQALDEHRKAEADLHHRPLGGKPFAYVEAHIEQGPRLEAEAKDIGVVTGIQGSRWFIVELRGETAHAGTAPVSLRKDAVQDMIRAITALNALMTDPTDVLRFTVGQIDVKPNTSNTVADVVRFTIDFRHPDKELLIANGDAIEPTIRSAVKNCEVTVTERFHALPVEFDPLVTDAVQAAADAQGLASLALPSGAFHDAQFMVPLCPTGMIFVPCRKGVSHNPAEYSEPGQLAAGARVLAATLVELANR
ncbi:M20 family metallo-hydrolase [Roseomonas populi]|uniref:M20 family metallo-hydrolase n=1 Tax=Roseomonas populi TaxID=3121582 RepID=A0ABT1WXX4_9PROT|nr:M20 family metallo-hydrolase [Roseomonas pecuniae]MCR0980692.1 M20 family metallo-hydrolase [Roseomonas pecuniae]